MPRKHKVPDTKGMRPVYCSTEECGKFVCYEGIEIGIIQHKCHRCKNWTQVTKLPPDTDTTAPKDIREVRCPKCGRFLYLEAIVSGKVRTKCRGCGVWHTLDITPNGDDNNIDGRKTQQALSEASVRVSDTENPVPLSTM